jgi:hypothetical protein
VINVVVIYMVAPLMGVDGGSEMKVEEPSQ